MANEEGLTPSEAIRAAWKELGEWAATENVIKRAGERYGFEIPQQIALAAKLQVFQECGTLHVPIPKHSIESLEPFLAAWGQDADDRDADVIVATLRAGGRPAAEP